MKQVPDYNPRHVGEFVRELLKKKGMNETEYCNRTNISRRKRKNLFGEIDSRMDYNLYIATCIVLGLSEEEEKELLYAVFPHMGLLSHIRENRMDLNDAETLFDDLGLDQVSLEKNDGI